MTDEQRKQVADAQAARKAAKDAYDKAFDGIQPLRIAFVEADQDLRRLFKALNVTMGKTGKD
jgi:hypothetical protein